MKKSKQSKIERLIVVCYKLLCYNEELLDTNKRLKAQLKRLAEKNSCSYTTEVAADDSARV